MRDERCVAFLQKVLPGLGLRWAGFRKVRRQVCRRINRRMTSLGIDDIAGYEEYLLRHEEERETLQSLCRVTISRFWRDRGVWLALEEQVLPDLAGHALSRGASALRAMSIGSASGEEPYSFSLLWNLRVRPTLETDLDIMITAVESDSSLVERAEKGIYGRSSIKDVPPDIVAGGFMEKEGRFYIRPEFRSCVEFRTRDIREEIPEGLFDLILCRNLVFTYFDEKWQAQLLFSLLDHLRPQGVLITGAHELLPPDVSCLTHIRGIPCSYKKSEK